MDGGNIGKGSSGFRMDHSFNWEITGLRGPALGARGAKSRKVLLESLGMVV